MCGSDQFHGGHNASNLVTGSSPPAHVPAACGTIRCGHARAAHEVGAVSRFQRLDRRRGRLAPPLLALVAPVPLALGLGLALSPLHGAAPLLNDGIQPHAGGLPWEAALGMSWRCDRLGRDRRCCLGAHVHMT
jgi:hypothetical protein